MAEWSNAPDSKSGLGQPNGGSNPSLSATDSTICGVLANTRDSLATLDALNPSVRERAAELGTAFAANAPFPHVVIDEFLDHRVALQLLEEFPAFERGNFVGDDGKPGPKSAFRLMHRLGPTFAALDRTIQSAAFLELLGRLTNIDRLLYDPFYLGGGTHENRSGAALDPHVDFNYHPSERWHRRLNLLLYLNTQWQADWGGALQLFADPRSDPVPPVAIEPVFNRCVIFATTERSWHGFDAVRIPKGHVTPRSRKSIALYFYTRERPAEEVGPRHSTLYVQRPLPPDFVPGHSMTADDVDTLRSLVHARDAYIDRLHAENTRLLQAQEHGLAGQILYLMKRAYVRFRR